MSYQKKHRRTCIDHIRRDISRRSTRRTKSSKLALLLLSAISALLALVPDTYAHPEVDRGAAARERERGSDPVWYGKTSRAAPSWNRLVKDLSRRSTKDLSRSLIEKRVPAEAVLWLREMIADENWAALRALGRTGERTSTEDEIADLAVDEARRWEADRVRSRSGGGDLGPDGRQGGAAAGSKPGFSHEGDDDDDPSSPPRPK